MPAADSPTGAPAFGRLQELARRKPPAESCDLCGRPIAPEHDHLVEPAARRLVCACAACALLFPSRPSTKFKRVPRRKAIPLPDFQLSDGQWDDLRIPINLAFFFFSSVENRVVACYPSPAGATESLLPLETWEEIAAANPRLREMEPDVEALLVNRIGYARGLTPAEYFLVPADRCYELVGLIRSRWKGLSGGTEVWREIGRFFAELRGASDGKPGGSGA